MADHTNQRLRVNFILYTTLHTTIVFIFIALRIVEKEKRVTSLVKKYVTVLLTPEVFTFLTPHFSPFVLCYRTLINFHVTQRIAVITITILRITEKPFAKFFALSSKIKYFYILTFSNPIYYKSILFIPIQK